MSARETKCDGRLSVFAAVARILTLSASLAFSGFACNGAPLEDDKDNDERDAKDDDKQPEDGGGLDASVGPWLEVGTPDEVSTTTFVQLDDDDDVAIRDGGQGGTHAMIALRFSGLGNWIFYQVGIENLDADGSVLTPELVRPRPAPCEGEGDPICKVSPIFVQLGGLADRSEWDGLHVEITGFVSNEDGIETTDTLRAYLRR